jgi:mono/diheme cytochrome c family protein
MKKIISISGAILIVVCITPAIARSTAVGQTAEKPESVTIQADIYKIFQGSCTDCHAKGGKKMAMSHVNFSEWDN